MNIKHWWYGCPEYNQKYPSWIKKNIPALNEVKAICKVCGRNCWWAWGYTTNFGTQLFPDLEAQKILQNNKNKHKEWSLP